MATSGPDLNLDPSKIQPTGTVAAAGVGPLAAAADHVHVDSFRSGQPPPTFVSVGASVYTVPATNYVVLAAPNNINDKVTLPAAPADASPVWLICDPAAIVGLAYFPNAGQTVLGSNPRLTPGAVIAYVYDAPASQWVPVTPLVSAQPGAAVGTDPVTLTGQAADSGHSHALNWNDAALSADVAISPANTFVSLLQIATTAQNVRISARLVVESSSISSGQLSVRLRDTTNNVVFATLQATTPAVANGCLAVALVEDYAVPAGGATVALEVAATVNTLTAKAATPLNSGGTNATTLHVLVTG